MSVQWFVCGWCTLEARAADASAVLNLCMRYGMNYRHWKNMRDGECVRFEMTAYTASNFCRRCEEEGIPIHVVRRGGLPHLMYRYRHRVGLLIGGMLGLAIVIASSRVLWDIRISGNQSMTVRQVREELAASGLSVGMPLSSLDTGEAEMRIQLDSEHISWVSINMSGTVAHVEIRERVPTPPKEPLLPANLIARCEGIVEELEVYAGIPVVQAGQAVQTGELLVSGLYDSQSVGWRVTRAAGRIMARTVHEFSVEIPLNYEEKSYLDEPIVKKTLIFFEKEIKLFKNSGILGESCDKISNVDSCTLGVGVSLPISLKTEYYLPYVYRTSTRDYAQAQTLAYYELERQISQALPDAMLLRKVITATLDENVFCLQCEVHCLENIAGLQPFSVEELPQ